jgi:DNA-binding beta-propeller fold protein YncE
VAAPTLASHDPIYRITPERLVETFIDGFGRPQGVAFDSEGDLYVVEALAGAAGVYRVSTTDGAPRSVLLASAPMLTGIAFDPAGGVVLASSDTIWRLDVPVSPLSRPFTGS